MVARGEVKSRLGRVLLRAYRHTASALLLTLALAAGGSGATPLWQAAAPTAVPVAVGGVATNVPPAATVRPRSTLADARFSTAGWRTDCSMSSLPLGELTPGGPGRDGIPPIDAPRFVTVTAANAWLKPREPVIVVARGALARAYPLQILIWHAIVNDDFGGAPLAVTFCPLCNTAIAFDRRLAGRVLDFGTTGNVRNPDLVMWDRQTESWWQQITGEAIVGELTGQRLAIVAATIVSSETFVVQYPQGQVLSRETGYDRSYGRNPYVGYDDIDTPPFLYDGPLDGRLPPKERVVTVSLGGEDVAYPFGRLAERRVVAATVGGEAIVVLYQPGTASVLDTAQIAEARDIGAAGVYRPEADGRPLTFAWRDGAFVDLETGSTWSVLGLATAGPLAGKPLAPVVHGDHFWFAWAIFKPQARIFGAR